VSGLKEEKTSQWEMEYLAPAGTGKGWMPIRSGKKVGWQMFTNSLRVTFKKNVKTALGSSDRGKKDRGTSR